VFNQSANYQQTRNALVKQYDVIMDASFFTYLERLELMAFFAAYPLVYTLLYTVKGSVKQPASFLERPVALLPVSYALCGTLFIGLQLKNMYPDFSEATINEQLHSWIKIWGILAVLFWIPAIRKRPILSLLHSLVVFFFLLKDVYLHLRSQTGDDTVRNDMKIFTDSLILISGLLFLLVILDYLRFLFINRKKPV
jgi:hypothetical protein